MSTAAGDAIATLSRRLAATSWFQRSVVLGGLLTIVWMNLSLHGLDQRLLRDGLLFFAIPMAFALAHDRTLGWQVDRRAVRDALLLSAFVTPFYVVGSTLPGVREFYPMWGLESAAPAAFVPHAIKQFLLVVAGETFFRGLFCVGLREKGPWVAFISPVIYALLHANKPPIELLLSGPTDVLFGLSDYHANSLLPSICAHGLGLILLDWLVLHDPLIDPETAAGWFEWLPIVL
nr:CPBP family intramembrane glutamic endopeptidase [Salinarchaeum laminariae]